jgi:hypothetical protein
MAGQTGDCRAARKRQNLTILYGYEIVNGLVWVEIMDERRTDRLDTPSVPAGGHPHLHPHQPRQRHTLP